MDLDMGEDGGGRGERVKTRLPNDAYACRLFAPLFQIRRILKSDCGLVIYKVQILAVLHTQEMNSRNHVFEFLAIGACPKMMRQSVRTYTMC